MKKKQIKMKYPYASINISQAEGIYGLHVGVAEHISIEVYLDDTNLDNLEQDIQSIREHQKLIKTIPTK